MQIYVDITHKERRKALSIALSRSIPALQPLRLIALLTFLASPVYHLIWYRGRVAPALLARWVSSSPLLYLGLLFCILLSPPVLVGLEYWLGQRRGNIPKLFPATLLLDEGGISCFKGAERVSCHTWYCVTEVVCTKHLLIALRENGYITAIPLRCFASTEEAARAEAQMRTGLNAARGGFAPHLALEERGTIWRFRYTFDIPLATAALSQLTGRRVQAVTHKNTGALIASCLLSLLVLFFSVIGIVPAYIAFPLVALSLFALIMHAARSGPSSFQKLMPGWLLGEMLLEIGPGGVRVQNSNYEAVWGYDQLGHTKSGPLLVCILVGKAFATALPVSIAPPEAIRDAVAYIETSVTGNTQ